MTVCRDEGPNVYDFAGCVENVKTRQIRKGFSAHISLHEGGKARSWNVRATLGCNDSVGLVPESQSLEQERSPRNCERYTAGVTPILRRKTRVKWLWSANPAASAMAARDWRPPANCPQAKSTLIWRTYSPTVTPKCLRNSRARWSAETWLSAAISSNVSAS